MFGELKFDKMVDTGKAEEYMRTNKQVFHSIGYSDNAEYDYDNCNNKIMYGDHLSGDASFVTLSEWENPDNIKALSNKLKTLAQSVEENRLLFAQIEYMQRKKPINESLTIDLKLIEQNIIYVSSVMTRKMYHNRVLVMHKGSPLSLLGFVAQMLCTSEIVLIKSDPHMAVLCHLFVSLCHKAGLERVHLLFTKSIPNLVDIKELQPSGIGVVSERSDIDSAVDAFVASSTQGPWKIRRILVQECVTERLKEVLDWKSKHNHSNNKLNDVKTMECSSAYRINDKLFMFEYSGRMGKLSEDHVIIEAYRTVKELLSLFNTYKPFAASVWCADVSQANEIAYGIDSPVTWVNDYGSFYGPPKSSQAFFSIIDVSSSKHCMRPINDVKELTIVRDKWMKLDTTKRRELLNLAFQRAKEIDKSSYLDVNIDLNVPDGNFVEINNVGICVGLEMAALPVILFDYCTDINHMLACLLKGFIVTSSKSSTLDQNLFKTLQEVGAPLAIKAFEPKGEYELACEYSVNKTRVIRTNFGTIFAN